MCAFLFQMCAREPEGRKIHASSCNIDSPDPLSPCLRTVMVTKNSNPGGFSVEKVGRKIAIKTGRTQIYFLSDVLVTIVIAEKIMPLQTKNILKDV